MISLNKKMKRLLQVLLIALAITSFSSLIAPRVSHAIHCCVGCSCSRCCGHVGGCSASCTCVSSNETGTASNPSTTIGHITRSFIDHRTWLVDTIFLDSASGNPEGLLAAMQLMTNQLTAIGMQQVQAVGMFFDAKHQLETQRIFQTLVAKTQKDYQPSEALCNIGSTVKSLAGSSQIRTLSKEAIARKSIDRLTLSGDSASVRGFTSDKASRLLQFIVDFCNPADNARNLSDLCRHGNHSAILFNRDINFTQTLSSPLTIDVDFTAADADNPSNDEKSYFALMANLFGHETSRRIAPEELSTRDGSNLKVSGYEAFMDARALTAKRSVAINSLASIGAMKAKGTPESQPFVYAVLNELGSSLSATDIEEILGDRPSYHAQMEVLTKIANQNPDVVTDLMDKPANVARKDVALQAIGLMQKRDAYRSLLRSEAVIATMLETALMEEQERLTNIIRPDSTNVQSGGN